MSMVHPGSLPASIDSLDHLAKAFMKACRRVFQANANHPTQPLPEDLEPVRMSRVRLAEELLAPCPLFTPMEVRDAACAGIAVPTGTRAQAVIMRRLAIARELLCRDLRSQLQGTLTETSVHAREVVKGALVHQAAAVAFGRNTPKRKRLRAPRTNASRSAFSKPWHWSMSACWITSSSPDRSTFPSPNRA